MGNFRGKPIFLSAIGRSVNLQQIFQELGHQIFTIFARSETGPLMIISDRALDLKATSATKLFFAMR